ncbi:uncharacterized protein [Physcomitrium patens]|uniref:Uncharacterized protein n=1 Tax=Physcomitrium patens TaxID=3218 RepID=A9S161_PHYPA|nr:uncharacterized protein LOC112273059 [Physcomitrium patens]XP_024357172.1 uncharacterized protein LOC112273059 [Physcomitrium patens]PNR33399.1 hypothetical protein PHYPA_025343 [Physcomitrium patens]|eukprot:XP_024357170.1 uncharacterized protein LOC112273059 [Physcomitrella patens]
MAGCWNDNRLQKVVRSHLDATDMDQVWKIKESEDRGRLRTRKPDKDNKSKTQVVPPLSRKSHPRNVTSFEGRRVSSDEVKAHEPKLVQLNLKPSLMGVHVCDEEDQFFSRQSSMTSVISDKFRSGIACISCGSEGQQGLLVDTHGRKRGTSVMATSISSNAGKGDKGGIPLAENDIHLNENGTVPYLEKSNVASSMFYPSPRLRSGVNSSIPNSPHSTFGTSGTDHTTDKKFKHRLGKSRLQKSSDTGVETTQNNSQDNGKIQSNNGSAAKMNRRSSMSAADPKVICPAAPTFSERLFGYEFSRDRSQRLYQPDTKCTSTQIGANEWQHSLHPGRCSISIHAMSDYDDTDEDDIIIEDDVIFQIPNDLALHCSQEHHADPATGGAKRKPSVERWSSNRKSFNLDLEQIPANTLSINVNGSRHHRSTEPGKSVKSRAKLDVSQRDISLSSLNSSVDGGSRRLKIGALDSFASERRRWLDFESELNDFVLNSGRLKMDITHEPDLDEPDLEQVKNELNKFQDDRAKMDEAAFPFNSPVASSFVFGNDGVKCPEDAHQQHLTISISLIPRILVSEMELDNEDFEHSDAYHDPDDIDADDGSISDTNSSLTTFSLEADSNGGLIDPHPQWVSNRSFKYVTDVVDHNSRYLDIECQSGRFSVDLRRDKRLDKADHVSRPAMKLRMLKTQKTSSRRSLLSPCLPFLHRQRYISRLQQRPLAASRRLSFTARLGPIEDAVPKLQAGDGFTARLGQPAETASKLKAINSFTARLGPRQSC